MRSSESRSYRMRRRAEQVEATRQRIIEAAVRLHGSVGPAATTIAGIAEEAGVTRLTVYRHFADDAQIFTACSAHWLAVQRTPDPASWGRFPDLEGRLRAGLTDVYRFYRDGEAMLTRIYRDLDAVPERHREGLLARDRAWRDILAEPAVKALTPARRRRLRAVLGHAIAFNTWRSLCVTNGLSNRAAVEVMVELAVTTAGRSG